MKPDKTTARFGGTNSSCSGSRRHLRQMRQPEHLVCWCQRRFRALGKKVKGRQAPHRDRHAWPDAERSHSLRRYGSRRCFNGAEISALSLSLTAPHLCRWRLRRRQAEALAPGPCNWTIEIIKWSDTAIGFVVLPRAGWLSALLLGSAAAAALPRTGRVRSETQRPRRSSQAFACVTRRIARYWIRS